MTDPIHPATDATRVAIELLTLWLEPGDDARLNAARHITKLTRDPEGPGAEHIIAGLLNLNMMTLLSLVKAQGADAGDMLDRAQAILREWSPQLPE